jgi:hypothetical protein
LYFFFFAETEALISADFVARVRDLKKSRASEAVSSIRNSGFFLVELGSLERLTELPLLSTRVLSSLVDDARRFSL